MHYLISAMKKVLIILTLFCSTAASLYATDCKATILGQEDLTYDFNSINAKDCTTMTIRFIHAEEEVDDDGDEEIEMEMHHMLGLDPSLEVTHNLVVAQTKDINSILIEGIKAGPAAGYLNAKNPKIVAATAMLKDNEEQSIKIDITKLVPGQSYSYFCTFPGHTTMRGKLIF